MPTTIHITDQGNQSIGGNKTFTGVATFSGQQVNLVDTALNLSGVGDMTFEGTNINFINSPVFISGTNLRVVGDVIGNNLVYDTGNQTISGIKTFNSRPTVNGTGVLLIGEGGGGVVENVVYTTGNQTISGIKTFDVFPIVSGNKLITGVDLSSYATITNLASTGSTLDTKINTLSGSSVLLYGNQSIGGIKTFRDNVYINNLFVTGAETIVSTNNFNVQSPYLVLNLTGGAIDGGIFFITGSGLTGINDTGPIIGFDHSNKFKFGVSTRNSDLSTLPDIASVQNITAYSGFVDGKYSTIINLASTGSTLDTKINNLSGYVTGANATFASITNLGNTGSNLDTKINNVSGYFTGTNATLSNNLASTGSTLATNLASTGSNLDTKINNLSGVSVLTFSNQTISGTKTFVTGIVAPNLVYNTGEQFVSGLKKFDTRPTVNGTGVLLNGEASSATLPTTIVYTTGDQTISGVKNFAFRPTVNGTGVLLIGGAGTQGAPDIATTINISSNTISLDLYNFSYFLINLNSNITTTNFNNPKAAPEVTSFVLQLSGDGTIRSVTWPTSLRWPGSTAPTITIGPNKVDTYSIFSYDGGVSYYGFPAGYNS